MKDVFEDNGPEISPLDGENSDQPLKPKMAEEVNSPGDVSARSTKKKTLEALCSLRCHYNSMAHLKSVEDFYSPRKSEAVDTADNIHQIALSTCTPRLLVLPLQSTHATSPNSSHGEDKDIKSVKDVSDIVDGDVESSSETGWSVRDNPMASSDSSKSDAESDDENNEHSSRNHGTTDLENAKCLNTPACKRKGTSMALHVQGRMKEPAVNLTQELDCLCILYPETEERVIKPDVAHEIRLPREGLSRSNSCTLPQEEAMKNAIVADSCSCNGKDCDEKQHLDEDAESLCKQGLSHAVEVVSPPNFHGMDFRSRVLTIVSRSLLPVRSYSEVFLGGSLLVMLALPFAMLISRLFSYGPELHRLLPT